MSRFLIATARPMFGASAVCGAQSSIAERILSAPFAVLATWGERLKQRATLAEMDDRMLQDIGVDRSVARAEADKPFWTA
ncbi:MAG: DUF1127 domain-containing protein [Thalassobaculum sp.]|uniref:DUF1127 domain-containing protein n=1 Tax=Thalassobaculum sp. TaxID=2022740 RepID=UPI0032F00F43